MTSSSEGEILQVSQKQKIGGGGFGEIYEAFDIQNHNERVAVKIVLKQKLEKEVVVFRRISIKICSSFTIFPLLKDLINIAELSDESMPLGRGEL
ncbi:unnamed protein product [Cylicostephanus goldi]|uniref:Protein kinase domain-containing protein n=1 Tax=Cylicostephanus goldi TaxID=71465 RepID=A0A3P7M0B1_CYLGO|nr:unnamed protein product [Cylicostephanus goldi]